MRKNSNKNLRVNGEVQKVIAEAIRFSKDPRISPMTSVVETVVAPDLKTCKVWVSVMGSDEEKEATKQGLECASGYIRSVVAKELNMRNTPQITFIMDDSIAYAIDMTKKIDEVTALDRLAQEKRGELEEAAMDISEEGTDGDVFD